MTPTYFDRLADRADKAAFGVVWLIGTVAIVVLKALGLSQFVVTSVPVSLVLLYALYISLFPRVRIRDDRAGDSLYYLGFLFTMDSVAYALYEFSQGGGVESIIANFGIALSTTIVGLVLRVLFHQMRDNPLEIEREARLEMAATVSQLRAELFQSIEDFGTLRRAAVQNAATAMDDITAQTHEKLIEMAATQRTVIEELAKGASAFHEAAERELGRAKADEAGARALEQAMAGLQTGAEAARRELTSLTIVIREEHASERVGLDTLKAALNAAQNGIESLVSVSRTAVEEQLKVVRSLSSGVASQLTDLQRNREAMQRELDTSSAAMRDVYSAMTSVARLIVENVREH